MLSLRRPAISVAGFQGWQQRALPHRRLAYKVLLADPLPRITITKYIETIYVVLSVWRSQVGKFSNSRMDSQSLCSPALRAPCLSSLVPPRRYLVPAAREPFSCSARPGSTSRWQAVWIPTQSIPHIQSCRERNEAVLPVRVASCKLLQRALPHPSPGRSDFRPCFLHNTSWRSKTRLKSVWSCPPYC